MNESLRSMLLGTVGLSAALAVAIALTLARPFRPEGRGARGRASLALLMGVGVQCLHFAEELRTGFAEAFPTLWGLSPWPPSGFVAFNLVWIVIWIVAAAALARGWRIALVPAWFFGLAMVANGIAHPLLALRVGGYFPGLMTAPLAGVAGLWVLARLMAATEAAARSG